MSERNEAAERVRDYLYERTRQRGLDPDVVHVMNGLPLLVSDLETQAEARAELDALGDGYDWRVFEVREPGISNQERESAMDAKEAFRKLIDIANGPLPTTKKSVDKLVGQITEALEKERDYLQERVDDLTNALEDLESATNDFKDAESADREGRTATSSTVCPADQ